MAALRWLGRGIERLGVALGVAFWLALGIAAVLVATGAVDFQSLPQTSDIPISMQIAAGAGAATIGVLSIAILAISRSWRSFGLTVAYGALLLCYGANIFAIIGQELGPLSWLHWTLALAILAIAIAIAGAPRFTIVAHTAAGLFAASVLSFGAYTYAGFFAGETVSGTAEYAEAPASAATQFELTEMRFNRSQSMRINKSYVVGAQIGSPNGIAMGDGPVATREVPIPSSHLVRMELIGEAFDIEPLHQVNDVLIEPGFSGQWSWRVTPRASGNQRLIVQVFGVLRTDTGLPGRLLLKTYEERVVIEVTALDQAEVIAREIIARWDLIAGVLGAIGGAWVLLTNVIAYFRRQLSPSLQQA